jgi:MATE family multidrug resistance protein
MNRSLDSAAPESAYSWRDETRLLWRQALPNVGMTLGRLLIGVTDFVMVSLLGTDAQAAIAPATFLVFVIMCVGMAIAGTVTTFSAQAFGRGDRREAGAYAWQSLYLAAGFTLLCGPLMGCMEPLFGLFDHAPAVHRMEVDYCRIAVWSMGPSIAVAGLNGFFVGVQRPMVGFYSVLVALLWNRVGNYALIFGKWGFPALGVRGAAVATVGAWTVRAGIMLVIFLQRGVDEEFQTRGAYAPSAARMRRLIAVGAPSAAQWLLDIGAWFLFLTYLIARFGTGAMAAANVCWQYMQVSFMPAIGVGLALCSLVGCAIGEGRPGLALYRSRIALVITSVYMGAAGLLFCLARRPLMQLLSDDPAVIALGAGMLVWVGIFQVFDGLFHVYHNALRGAGDTRGPAVAVALTCWGIFLLGGWAAVRWAPGLGYHGPWLACTAYIVVLGLVLWRRFERGGWRRIRLFEAAAADAAV